MNLNMNLNMNLISTSNMNKKQTYLTHLISSALLILFVLFVNGCSGLKYDIQPDETRTYRSLVIKANVKNKENGKKGSFRILLKYDETADKMMFLSPVNQVVGLLTIEGENALLVNSKKKRYWKGRFNTLLREIWGMDFEYAEFKHVLDEGIIPGEKLEEKLKERGIDVIIEKIAGNENENENVNETGTKTKTPERITIETGQMQVKIKITDRKTGKGSIRFAVDIHGMKQTGIRELFD
jgi:hypothetical protein